jgi:aminopeptidase C
MQAAQLRLYQGRFFLISQSECEIFDKYRRILESNNSTADFAQAQTAFWDRYEKYEVNSEQIERLRIPVGNRKQILPLGNRRW